MKAVGVIVEYNPFHLGHGYHLKQAKEKSGADVVVAVMSGNWVQRGEPAIIDKWQRAKAALENGCDLVVELPLHYALQSADYFAKGGVKLLNALKVSTIAFGTDVTTSFDYQVFGEKMLVFEKEIKQELAKLKHSGFSYPKQMHLVYETLNLQGNFSETTPNHLLALTYAKEVALQNPAITLLPIQRLGQGYKEVGETKSFASASALRKMALVGDFSTLLEKVPLASFNSLKTTALVTWEAFFPYLRYQLIATPKEELQTIYQMTEGLEYRLKEQLDAKDFASLLENLKTKRYSKGRLQRLLSYVFLKTTRKDMLEQPDFLRILGFTEKGQAYLNQIKKELDLPLISQQQKKYQDLLALNNRGDALYALAPQVTEQVKDRPPLRMKA